MAWGGRDSDAVYFHYQRHMMFCSQHYLCLKFLTPGDIPNTISQRFLSVMDLLHTWTISMHSFVERLSHSHSQPQSHSSIWVSALCLGKPAQHVHPHGLSPPSQFFTNRLPIKQLRVRATKESLPLHYPEPPFHRGRPRERTHHRPCTPHAHRWLQSHHRHLPCMIHAHRCLQRPHCVRPLKHPWSK